MKYKVIARSWNDELKSEFGESDGVHELSDAQVVAAILKHGRASIVPQRINKQGQPWQGDEGIDRTIEFENSYD